MSEWKEYKLEEVAEIEKNSWKVGDEELPYIALEHIVEGGLRLQGIGDSNSIASNKYRFNSDCFLFGKLRPYFRKLYRPDFEGICSTDIWVVKPKDENDKDFLFYFFANQEFIDFTYSGSSGTRMPRADWKFVGESEWNFPEPTEQKAIAEVLSSLDDKIDLLHRQNKTLEQMAETLFRQWFIEEAKEDWEVGKLGDLINLNYGKGLKKEIRTGNGFPVVGSNGIVDYHSEFIVNAPGIVIGRKGTLGKVIYLWRNFYPIDTTYFVTSKQNSINLLYEYFLLKTLNFGDMNSDSAVPGLNRDIALSQEIMIPPNNLRKMFDEKVKYNFNKIYKNQQQILTLEKMRDTLLPKLMSGEVRVDK